MDCLLHTVIEYDADDDSKMLTIKWRIEIKQNKCMENS